MRAIAILAIVLVASGCRELNPDFAGNGTEDSGSTSIDDSTSSTGTMSTSTSMSSSDATTSTSMSTSSSSSSSSSSDGSSESSSSSSGSTTSGCPDGETDCFGNCVDLMTNQNNCGECGNDCHPVQETCVDGNCTPN